MKNPLDIQLLEELSNLEYFIVKAPLNSRDFWKEWQDKFSRAYMTRIAIKKLLRTKKASYEEVSKYKSMIELYEDVLYYLELLKNLALQMRGVYSPEPYTEFDDEDIDLDF
jgi:hypothetical protein